MAVKSKLTRTEINSKHKWHSWNERTPELQPPCNFPSIYNNQIRDEAQEDPKRGPHLPTHYERSTDCRGCVLSSVNGYWWALAAHTETEEDTTDEELRPGLREGRTDDREEAEHGRDEDGTATAEEIVQGIRAPTTTVRSYTGEEDKS